MLIDKLWFKNGVLIVSGLFFLTLMIVLLAMTTLRPVEQSEYAVEYNNYTCQFGRILEQGKYTTDVGVTLIPFQRTLQDLRLGEMQCLTKDQVLITLDVNMQVQYYRDKLIPMVLEQFSNNTNYKDFLEALAKSAILNTCLLFSSFDFYSQRSMIDVKMADELKDAITVDNSGSSVEFFQLINIMFPDEYKSLILQKQNTEQSKITLLNNRQNEITAAETRLAVANNTANIKLIQAKQKAQSVVNQAVAEASVVESFFYNRGLGYEAVLKDLDFNSSQLVEYIKAETIRNTKNKLVASVNP